MSKKKKLKPLFIALIAAAAAIVVGFIALMVWLSTHKPDTFGF
jgi:hypothetical protein